MSTSATRRLALLASLGLLAPLATLFQLTLPRLRSEWITSAVDQHNLVLHAAAGSPWQYRIFSDYLIEPVIRALLAAQIHDPYQYGLFAFVLFRGAQMLCIFGLGLVYFRKLGPGPLACVVGLAIVCTAMLVGQIETNWQLDAYTDVILYVLAAILVLSRRFGLVILVTVLAALNRETGVFIPLMPLACVNVRALRSSENLPIYRAVAVGVVLFVLVRIGLSLTMPSQDTSTRLFPDDLVSSLKIRGLYAFVATALGVVPLVGAFGLRASPPFVRFLFWLILPVWMAAHAWGNLAMTPIPFLVPLTLVIVPSALFAAEAVRTRSHALFGSAPNAGLAAHWQTVAALVVVYLIGPVVAGMVRLDFPFPLERIEGTMLQEVRRVVLGLPLYAAPSLDYVPLLYAPVYVYASAGLALLTGASLVPLRMVSLAAAVGSAWLVYRLVARDAPGRLPGFLAAGLLLGTTQLTPTDRYPARVDTLCLLLVLAAIAAARRADRQPNAAPQLSTLCGVLIALAILTKQTAAVVGLPLLLLGLPRFGARVVPYAAGAGVTLAAAALVLLVSSDGWARFYLVDLPRNHGVEWSMIGGLWTQYLMPHTGVALIFAVAFFVLGARRGAFASVRFYALTATGLIGMSWVGVLNPGGGVNSMGPAYAAVAMLLGLGFQATLEVARVRRPLSRALPVGVLMLAGLALATLEFSPDQPASLRANARAGERLAAAIAALPGPVYAPDLEEYQHRAGKGDHATAAGVQELLGAFGGKTLPEGQRYLDALDQALSSRQYAYVLYDPEGFDLKLKDVLSFNGYESAGPLMAGDDTFLLWRRGASSGGGALTPAPILYTPRKRAG